MSPDLGPIQNAWGLVVETSFDVCETAKKGVS
jgi:hypothetical protein